MVSSYTLVAALALFVACVSGQGYRGQGIAGRQGLSEKENYASARNIAGLQDPEGFDPQQGDNQYKFRIYTEPEYYGYESVFPGGRANFKAYKSSPDTGAFGERGNRENLEMARPDTRFNPSRPDARLNPSRPDARFNPSRPDARFNPSSSDRY
ncbi:uncharacterized protein [Anabrus simplex]|uniref:uncharacterized protein n=1 Tax=Anabrus simplex TaxID=316456 RepID=UPI0035A3D538